MAMKIASFLQLPIQLSSDVGTCAIGRDAPFTESFLGILAAIVVDALQIQGMEPSAEFILATSNIHGCKFYKFSKVFI